MYEAIVADLISCGFCGAVILRWPDGRRFELPADYPIATASRPHLHTVTAQIPFPAPLAAIQ